MLKLYQKKMKFYQWIVFFHEYNRFSLHSSVMPKDLIPSMKNFGKSFPSDRKTYKGKKLVEELKSSGYGLPNNDDKSELSYKARRFERRQALQTASSLSI